MTFSIFESHFYLNLFGTLHCNVTLKNMHTSGKWKKFNLFHCANKHGSVRWGVWGLRFSRKSNSPACLLYITAWLMGRYSVLHWSSSHACPLLLAAGGHWRFMAWVMVKTVRRHHDKQPSRCPTWRGMEGEILTAWLLTTCKTATAFFGDGRNTYAVQAMLLKRHHVVRVQFWSL